jgi:hypothetical protein
VTAVETMTEVGKKYRPDDLLLWWQERGSECGSWAAAAQLFALFQPHLPTQRGFAMLQAAVGHQQQEDMVEVHLCQCFSIKDTSLGMD